MKCILNCVWAVRSEYMDVAGVVFRCDKLATAVIWKRMINTIEYINSMWRQIQMECHTKLFVDLFSGIGCVLFCIIIYNFSLALTTDLWILRTEVMEKCCKICSL